jgi:hypothetical protein
VTEEDYNGDDERSIEVTVRIEDKHVLDLVSAILCERSMSWRMYSSLSSSMALSV